MSANKSAWYDAAVRTAVIAGLFIVVVSGLLVVNHYKTQEADPRSSVKLAAMKKDLKKHKRDEKRKAAIRKLDRELRAEYLARIEYSREGSYLLLGGLVVFLIAVPCALRFRRRLPSPDPDSRDLQIARNEAVSARKSLAVLALTAVAGLAVLAAFSRGTSDSELAKAARGNSRSGSSGPSAVAPGGTANLPFGQPPPLAGTPPSGSPVSPVSRGPLPLPPAGVEQIDTKPAADSSLKVEGGVVAEGDAPSAADIARKWPTFRAGGAVVDGHYPTHWNGAKGEGIVWKTKIALPGENSPIVWDDKVFVSGADENNREVYCVDADSGKVIWKQPVPVIVKGSEKPNVMSDTGYAAPTMVADGKRAYAIFANCDVVCFDFNGNKLWEKALGTPESTYGYASSLAMYKSLLIVQLDQGSSAKDAKSTLIALQASSGKVVWMTKRPVPNSWTSPIVVSTGKRDEIVTSANPWVIGYDAATGKELWRADCMSGDVAPSAVFADGMIYACNTGACLAAVKADETGDITKSGIAWTATSGLPDIASPATNGDVTILAQSEGTVTCYDAKKGAKLWEHAYETGFNASPVFVGDLIYLIDVEGVAHIISAGKSFKEVSTSPLGEKCSATPALAGGKIFIRGKENLYCAGVK